MNITKTLKSAVKITLPPLIDQNRCNEIWKNDHKFNRLLSQRRHFPKQDAECNAISMAVKKRIKHLRNEKLREETDDINENANQRQVEELYKNIKDGSTTFKIILKKQVCDPYKVTEHFRHILTDTPKALIQLNLQMRQVLLKNFRILKIPNEIPLLQI